MIPASQQYDLCSIFGYCGYQANLCFRCTTYQGNSHHAVDCRFYTMTYVSEEFVQLSKSTSLRELILTCCPKRARQMTSFFVETWSLSTGKGWATHVLTAVKGKAS